MAPPMFPPEGDSDRAVPGLSEQLDLGKTWCHPWFCSDSPLDIRVALKTLQDSPQGHAMGTVFWSSQITQSPFSTSTRVPK